jgi:hypothetical protein
MTEGMPSASKAILARSASTRVEYVLMVFIDGLLCARKDGNLTEMPERLAQATAPHRLQPQRLPEPLPNQVARR